MPMSESETLVVKGKQNLKIINNQIRASKHDFLATKLVENHFQNGC